MRKIKLSTSLYCLTLLITASVLSYANQTDLTPAAQVGHTASDADLPLPEGVDLETGYRMGRYRAAVPTTNPGTEVVDTARAFELHQTRQVVFIDVYPPRGMGADPLDGSWVISEKDHHHIEHSTWLPEVGRGHLEPEHVDYFERNLTLLSKGDKSTPLLFYCTADCWQSWNAARRALLWGYSNIFWYPDGTDGWIEEEHPVVPAEPVNFFGE